MSERTEQQREAAFEHDRDVFLRAGAGTGKTTVLVDRFCAAALDPDGGVERILAFTFTERAADQLRRRVREELAERASAAEGTERQELLAAAEASDRAWISTIHGFCRRVLASHPAAAGLDPRFRVLDEPEADRLASRAFDSALEQMVEEGDSEALELAAANRPWTLLQMTRGAYDELRSHGDPSPTLPEAPAIDSAAAVRDLIEAAREAHTECAEAKGAKGEVSRERIAAAMALDPKLEADEELLESLATLTIVSDGGAFKGEACERYTAALRRARAAVAGRVLGPAYEQLRDLIERFGHRYEELKAERSALDFEDLQLRALELLRSSEPIRERYRDQFLHLMVDEFQDTNSLQLGLIEQLHGPETNLFLVGDEFQSIYGFRHANVDVYRREHRRFADGAAGRVALPLTGNFRATPEVLAVTNMIGAALLDGFEPLTAGTPDATEQAEDEPPAELLLTVDNRKAWEAEETALPRLQDDPSSGSKVAEARRLAGRLPGAGRRRRGPGRDRRPAAGVHPCRGIRDRTGRSGPQSVCGRRARFLVPAADRGSALPAGGDRESAPRRGAVRGARLAGLWAASRHPLVASQGGHRARRGRPRVGSPHLAYGERSGRSGCPERGQRRDGRVDPG